MSKEIEYGINEIDAAGDVGSNPSESNYVDYDEAIEAGIKHLFLNADTVAGIQVFELALLDGQIDNTRPIRNINMADLLMGKYPELADAVAPFLPSDENTNCLAGWKCPNCGNEHEFDITVTTKMRFTDEGAGDHEDTTYTDDSPAVCGACNHEGTVALFTRQPWTRTTAPNPCVVLTMEGGLIDDIFTDAPVTVLVADRDIEGSDGDKKVILGEESVLAGPQPVFDPERVAQAFDEARQ